MTDPDIAFPVRLAVDEPAPHIDKAMSALDAASRETSPEAGPPGHVRARASQLNGYASCVDTRSAWNRLGATARPWPVR